MILVAVILLLVILLLFASNAILRHRSRGQSSAEQPGRSNFPGHDRNISSTNPYEPPQTETQPSHDSHSYSAKDWPSISDDEFLAKCPPGTRRDIALGVRRIIAEQLGVDYECIHPEQSFVRDLGC